MREIKFRGKSTETKLHTKQWRFGSLLTPPNEACDPLIYERFPRPMHDGNGFWYEVEADTVGQFTGLYDTDGREIYEGDVIRSDLLPHMRTTVCNGCVEYRNGAFYVEYIDHTYANLGDLIFYSGTSSTVIGNIHDNPGLLEKQP